MYISIVCFLPSHYEQINAEFRGGQLWFSLVESISVIDIELFNFKFQIL